MKNLSAMFGITLLLTSLTWGTAFADSKMAAGKNSFEFKPHWGFLLGLNSSGTPGDRGGGQNANDLSFTVSREFSESGDFLSLGLMGGQQKVEGFTAKYGSLSLDGGLGLGFFSPSLSLTAQTGEASLFSTTLGINLGFQLFDDIGLGLNGSGGFTSHQTPLPLLAPGAPDVNVEVDGKSFAGGLSVTWATSEIFSLSLAGQTTNEITYQLKFKGPKTSLTIPINQSSVIPSGSLGFNWAFLKDFSLSGSVQRSEEFEPAGVSYSPSLGETVDNADATTLYFTGYTIGLTYSFQ